MDSYIKYEEARWEFAKQFWRVFYLPLFIIISIIGLSVFFVNFYPEHVNAYSFEYNLEKENFWGEKDTFQGSTNVLIKKDNFIGYTIAGEGIKIKKLDNGFTLQFEVSHFPIFSPESYDCELDTLYNFHYTDVFQNDCNWSVKISKSNTLPSEMYISLYVGIIFAILSGIAIFLECKNQKTKNCLEKPYKSIRD